MSTDQQTVERLQLTHAFMVCGLVSVYAVRSATFPSKNAQWGADLGHAVRGLSVFLVDDAQEAMYAMARDLTAAMY